MINRQQLTVTNGLILLCIIAFVLQNNVMPAELDIFKLYYFENPNFKPVQLIGHMFMHSGFQHLLFNMFGLWMFGNAVEQALGHKKFLTFYLFCGLGAAAIYLGLNQYNFQAAIEPLLSAGVNVDQLYNTLESSQYYTQYPTSKEATIIFNTPMVGASGALYGVLVAFAFFFPNHKIALIFLPVPIAAKFFVPILLCLDIFSEFTGFAIFGQNIAHMAHVGGAITAIILLLTVMKRKKNQASSFGIWRS